MKSEGRDGSMNHPCRWMLGEDSHMHWALTGGKASSKKRRDIYIHPFILRTIEIGNTFDNNLTRDSLCLRFRGWQRETAYPSYLQEVDNPGNHIYACAECSLSLS